MEPLADAISLRRQQVLLVESNERNVENALENVLIVIFKSTEKADSWLGNSLMAQDVLQQFSQSYYPVGTAK